MRAQELVISPTSIFISRDVEVVGVAPEGAQLIASGLSTEVVETILQSRAPSMRKLYALKWKLSLHSAESASSTQSTKRLVQFWSSRRPDCFVPAGLTHSTLKVHVVAIWPTTPPSRHKTGTQRHKTLIFG